MAPANPAQKTRQEIHGTVQSIRHAGAVVEITIQIAVSQELVISTNESMLKLLEIEESQPTTLSIQSSAIFFSK